MNRPTHPITLTTGLAAALVSCASPRGSVIVHAPRHHDVSVALTSLVGRVAGTSDVGVRSPSDCEAETEGCGTSPGVDSYAAERDPVVGSARGRGHAQGQDIEQRSQGSRPPAVLLESFDGHGVGMTGPHGVGGGRNPSDNSMAVGPNHIVEIVNSQIAVYTKKGQLFDTTGMVLFGPIGTNVLFAGFGGQCEVAPNGDAVVRYDQLAGRWLYVMPLFRRAPTGPGEPPGPFGMCYAVSTGPNPIGPYYRYAFERTLFPDYPRPAVWPDGYYVPTSTGDDVIEKHACVVDRTRMLRGEPATEQCVIVPDVNFLNNADLDGQTLPPAGAPNIVMATGGAQLQKDFEDDGVYAWQFHVDWEDPANTTLTGPQKITVAPYHYLCDGQLTRCVPQPDTDMRLDAQGDKIMQRLVYRNLGGHESIVAVHSVNTAVGAGGVRWYEFRLDGKRNLRLYQQGTYAPDEFYRWMASAGMDRQGNIGIGYSFGGAPHYAGQRFAGRLAEDPLGVLTFHETVLVEGHAAQTSTLRWEDYTQLSMDPTDDCTFWYVGDYLKENASSYTTRLGAFRLPTCLRGTIGGTIFYDRNHNGMREPNEPGLPGWPVHYASTGRAPNGSSPLTGALESDSNGNFSKWLPADAAYGDPTYMMSADPPTGARWSRTEGGNAYSEGAVIPMNDFTYRIRLRDRDDVVNVDFGNVCTAPNTGGTGSDHWLGRAGRSALSEVDEPLPETGQRRGPGRFFGRRMTGGWRAIVNSAIYLVQPDGSRFRVSGQAPFDTTYVELTRWLRPSTGGNAWYRTSQQLATTALNVLYGDQSGAVTVWDPIVHDWPSIIQLVDRVSGMLADRGGDRGADTAARQANTYADLLEELNSNRAAVTPPDPGACMPPLR